MSGFVYAIRADGTAFFKIGYSENPEARLRTLQTASPHALVLVAVARASKTWEERLHRGLREQGYHLRNEWFDFRLDVSPVFVDWFAGLELYEEAETADDRALVLSILNDHPWRAAA